MVVSCANRTKYCVLLCGVILPLRHQVPLLSVRFYLTFDLLFYCLELVGTDPYPFLV